MDPEKRTKQVERLDKRRLQGERARQIRDGLEGVLEEIRVDLYKQLVVNTSSDGNVADDIVWTMIGLERLISTLDRKVSMSNDAVKKLSLLEQQSNPYQEFTDETGGGL